MLPHRHDRLLKNPNQTDVMKPLSQAPAAPQPWFAPSGMMPWNLPAGVRLRGARAEHDVRSSPARTLDRLAQKSHMNARNHPS